MLGEGKTSSEIKVIKLKEDEPLTFGYITRKGDALSEMGQAFVEKLEAHKAD